MIARQPPKVLLTTLTQRTSAKGNVYLTGWLAKARVIGFRGDDDDKGNPTWNIYLSEPEPRPETIGTVPGSPDALAPATTRNGGSYQSKAPAGNTQTSAQQQRMNRAAFDLQRRHDIAMADLNNAIPD